MTEFINIDPEDVPNTSLGSRGRVSYPLLKSFLETGFAAAQLDRSEIKRPPQALYQTLKAYAEKHEMPVKLFTRRGELFFVRTDQDPEGEENGSS